MSLIQKNSMKKMKDLKIFFENKRDKRGTSKIYLKEILICVQKVV